MDVKPHIQSTTTIGTVISALFGTGTVVPFITAVLTVLGIPAADSVVQALGVILGAGLAIYGREKANTPVSGVFVAPKIPDAEE